jgi:hypothetical protein
MHFRYLETHGTYDAGLYDKGVGGNGSALGSASSHRLRSSHLVHLPVAPHDDNMVVIVPCGDM